MARDLLLCAVALTACGCNEAPVVAEGQGALPYQSFARVLMNLEAPELARGKVYRLHGNTALERLGNLGILPDLESASYYLQDDAFLGLLAVPAVDSLGCCRYLSAVRSLELRDGVLSVDMELEAIHGACALDNCVFRYIPAELLIVRIEGVDRVKLRYGGVELPVEDL